MKNLFKKLLFCLFITTSIVNLNHAAVHYDHNRIKRNENVTQYKQIRHEIRETVKKADHKFKEDVYVVGHKVIDHAVAAGNSVKETAIKVGEKIETKIGQVYKTVGKEMENLGHRIENGKNKAAEKAVKSYDGPVADGVSNIYSKLQYGYGTTADKMGNFLRWLGREVTLVGRTVGSAFRTGLHKAGDLLGGAYTKTNELVGEKLEKAGVKVHDAGTALKDTSNETVAEVRNAFHDTASGFKKNVADVVEYLGHSLAKLGSDTVEAGEVVERHKFIDTIKKSIEENSES